MFVRYTGNPPPLADRLDGVVIGVKELFILLGYGTIGRCTVGPFGPATPCDSSRIGRPPLTRQISRPWPGRSVSNPFACRFSIRKYSLPSRRTRTLKHSFAEPCTGLKTSFCRTVGSSTVGVSQP